MNAVIGSEPIEGVSTVDITTSTGNPPPVYDYASEGYTDILVFAYSCYVKAYSSTATPNLLVTVGLKFASGRSSLDDIEFIFKSSNGQLSGAPGIYAKTKSGNAVSINFSYSLKSYYFDGTQLHDFSGGYQKHVYFSTTGTFNNTLNENETKIITLSTNNDSTWCAHNMGSYGYFNYFNDLSTSVIPMMTIGEGATQWPANFIFNGQDTPTGWEKINDKVDDIETVVTALQEKVAANIPQSTEETYPTVSEFNSLLTALKTAGLMTADS